MDARVWVPTIDLKLPSLLWSLSEEDLGFLGGIDSKESACYAGNLGLILGSARSPEEGIGYLLQYSCLKNSMNGGFWQSTVHGVVGHV